MTGQKTNPWLKYPTPIHVYYKRPAIEDALALKRGLLEHLHNAKLFYSVKTNPLPALMRDLHDIGYGLEVITPSDFALAQKIKSASLVVNSIVPDESFYKKILTNPHTRALHVDSIDAAEVLAKVAKKLSRKSKLFFHKKKLAPVGIRIHDGDSHFGFHLNQDHLGKASKILGEGGLHISALHTHVNNHGGSGTLEKYEKIFSGNLERLLKAKEILESIQTDSKIISFDIGGGIDNPEVYRVPPQDLGTYHAGDLATSKDNASVPLFGAGQAIGKTIAQLLKKQAAEHINIFFEFGRAVSARCLNTIVTVESVKHGFYENMDVVITNGSTASLGPIHRAIHKIEAMGADKQNVRPTYVYGKLPHSADWIGQKILLPKVKRGDRLLIQNTGAYFLPLEARFGYGLPMIIDGSSGKILRKAEKIESAATNYK